MFRSLVRCSGYNAFFSKNKLLAAVNISKGDTIIVRSEQDENELKILNKCLKRLEKRSDILDTYSFEVRVLDEEQREEERREIDRLAEMSLEHAKRN